MVRADPDGVWKEAVRVRPGGSSATFLFGESLQRHVLRGLRPDGVRARPVALPTLIRKGRRSPLNDGFRLESGPLRGAPVGALSALSGRGHNQGLGFE